MPPALAAAETQTAPAVLMIRPAHFSGNLQTADSNFFTRAATAVGDVAVRARREFDALAHALAGAGIGVHQYPGQAGQALPDEVFPNNWLSLHADGTAVLYPLLAENRRRERRPDLLKALRADHGYRIDRVVDLTHLESRGEFLEGTGSVVLDRAHRVAYACRSPRTHEHALVEFASALGYEPLAFSAIDRSGRPIYHTNVLLSIGTHFAALCTGAIAAGAERRAVVERLEQTGHAIIDLSFTELEAVAGNLLELRGHDGSVIALSATALAALGATARHALERHGRLVTADIGTIERLGGGSVRCMLAEVALRRGGDA
jgi:hypothetical protein